MQKNICILLMMVFCGVNYVFANSRAIRDRIVGYWIVDVNKTQPEFNSAIAENKDFQKTLDDPNNPRSKIEKIYLTLMLNTVAQFNADETVCFFPTHSANCVKRLSPDFEWPKGKWSMANDNEKSDNVTVTLNIAKYNRRCEPPMDANAVVGGAEWHKVICTLRESSLFFAGKQGIDHFAVARYFKKLRPDDPRTKKPIVFTPDTIIFSPENLRAVPRGEGIIEYRDFDEKARGIGIIIAPAISLLPLDDVVERSSFDEITLEQIIQAKNKKAQNSNNTQFKISAVEFKGFKAVLLEDKTAFVFIKEYYLLDDGGMALQIHLYSDSEEELARLEKQLDKLSFDFEKAWQLPTYVKENSVMNATGTWTRLDYPGGTYTQPCGISGNNIIGTYHDVSEKQHYFLYNNGTWITLNMPKPGPLMINGIDGSTIVGSGEGHTYLYNINTQSYTVLDFPGVPPRSTIACGISNGNLVGIYNTHSFLYNGSTLRMLDYPMANGTEAHDIDGNSIIGTYQDRYSYTHGFLYVDGKWTRIDYPGADITGVSGISGDHIIGGSDRHGFIYTNGIWTVLDHPDAYRTVPQSISGNSVVGWYLDKADKCHGFLYRIP